MSCRKLISFPCTHSRRVAAKPILYNKLHSSIHQIKREPCCAVTQKLASGIYPMFDNLHTCRKPMSNNDNTLFLFTLFWIFSHVKWWSIYLFAKYSGSLFLQIRSLHAFYNTLWVLKFGCSWNHVGHSSNLLHNELLIPRITFIWRQNTARIHVTSPSWQW